jgi:hypothetical protein
MNWGTIAIWVHLVASTATQIYLFVEDWPRLNGWNWIIILPIDFFLGEIWPIFWLILRPLLG